MNMKKTIAVLCLVAFAAGAAEKKPLTEAERAERRAEMMRRTGGPVKIPPQGFVAMVDCQSRADFAKTSAKFTETFEGFGFAAKSMKSDKPFSIKDFSTKCAELGAGSVVFVVDDADLPMSLVSIETRAGLVNVAALATDNPNPALLTRRTCKMIGRVAMLASGGAESANPTSDLQPVTTLKELDMNEGQGDEVYVMMGVINGMAKAGVTAERRMTYKQACAAGLAPSPTNDIQKAIWEQAKAEKSKKPSNPLKVNFDPKTAPKLGE